MDKEKFLESIRPKPYLTFKEYDLEKRKESLQIIAENICPGFCLSSDEIKLYENALLYFSGDNKSEWPLNKGIYLYGKIGCGKTTFFKIFQKLCEANGLNNFFKKYTSTELIDGFQKKGFEYFETLSEVYNFGFGDGYTHLHILLDDLGQSGNSVKFYGSSTNIVSEFIQRRYIVYTDKYKLTHITSNIEPSEFKDEYGEFVSSRMREMFNVVIYPGSDKRI